MAPYIRNRLTARQRPTQMTSTAKFRERSVCWPVCAPLTCDHKNLIRLSPHKADGGERLNSMDTESLQKLGGHIETSLPGAVRSVEVLLNELIVRIERDEVV